jgi:hypothetical protein
MKQQHTIPTRQLSHWQPCRRLATWNCSGGDPIKVLLKRLSIIKHFIPTIKHMVNTSSNNKQTFEDSLVAHEAAAACKNNVNRGLTMAETGTQEEEKAAN